jgi:hypothetical protein
LKSGMASMWGHGPGHGTSVYHVNAMDYRVSAPLRLPGKINKKKHVALRTTLIHFHREFATQKLT